jgi:hypothetical protein
MGVGRIGCVIAIVASASGCGADGQPASSATFATSVPATGTESALPTVIDEVSVPTSAVATSAAATSVAATTIAWVTVPPRPAPPFTETLPVPSYTTPDETFPPDTGPPPSTFPLDAELPDFEWRVDNELIVRMATPDQFRQHPLGNRRVSEHDREMGLYALERWLVLDEPTIATFAIQPNFGPDWPPVKLQEYSETIIAGDLTWNLWNNATVENVGAEPNMGMALVGEHALMISGSLDTLHALVGTISVQHLEG